MGIVTSLEVLRAISENNFPQKNPIDFVIFVEGDGSKFSSVLLGNMIWAGKSKDEDLLVTLNEFQIMLALLQ